MYFEYGEKEIEYLKSRDKKLAEVIDKIGHIDRTVDDDLFSAVVHHIIGQQISTKAQQSIWKKVNDELDEVNADTLLSLGRDRLQQFGISFRKTDYILDFAGKVKRDEFDLESIYTMSDEEVIRQLSSLKGIGVWTAEMLLLFCLQRPNVFSFGDLAILRGIRMVYHHREVNREKFEKYRRRFSPYCSAASLYLWAVAGGAIPELKDYAPAKKKV
ncbi:MAG: DNA-3-methyladenine glycosylase 2 family protein [Eubacteriales bacterium]|nr:DNA-3-methyladenine glycosylase 2 family protein [Eubacteriales bacterium]